jgi:hypothetical protein
MRRHHEEGSSRRNHGRLGKLLSSGTSRCRESWIGCLQSSLWAPGSRESCSCGSREWPVVAQS